MSKQVLSNSQQFSSIDQTQMQEISPCSADPNSINISVIIPAYNSEATISRTIESLQSQSYRHWEAIVIDDESSDTTTEVVERFTQSDHRIRLVRLAHGGVSLARNTGLRLASFDWILFLDSDDWIRPKMLERMAEALAVDSTLVGVHCGWDRYALNGNLINAESYDGSEPFFQRAAYRCPFVINSFVVKRSVVESVGNFDLSFEASEDWLLWQRIARTGARIGRVDEQLACVMVRPNSLSYDPYRLLSTGLRVMTLGHSTDPAVRNPHADYAEGLDPIALPARKYALLAWVAGSLLGHGEDARPLLEIVEDPCPSLDPEIVAGCLEHSITICLASHFENRSNILPRVEDALRVFLIELEARTMAVGLAQGVHARLAESDGKVNLIQNAEKAGVIYSIRIEVTEPIENLHLPPSIERIVGLLELEGIRLGTVELPAYDGFVSGEVLADTIAAEFSWVILRKYFEHSIPRINAASSDSSESGGHLYADSPAEMTRGPYNPDDFDRVGWSLFLNDLCLDSPNSLLKDWISSKLPLKNTGLFARLDGLKRRLRQAANSKQAAPCLEAPTRWCVIEIGEEFGDLVTDRPSVDLVPQVGGVPISRITVPVQNGRIRASDLKSTIEADCAFELCRAVVREGLIGRPLDGSLSLAQILSAARARRDLQRTLVNLPHGVELAPNADHILGRYWKNGEDVLVVCRRLNQPTGSSVSRRAVLPAASFEAIVEAESSHGLILRTPSGHGIPEKIVYAPDVIWRYDAPRTDLVSDRPSAAPVPITEDNPYGRSYFEALFATQPDPWKYTNPYEQAKYKLTLSLLPEGRVDRAMELACAEGHFTEQLARHVNSLIATDISQVALRHASKRCEGFSNIDFRRFDLVSDEYPVDLDLIVCSEVLYYCGNLDKLHKVGTKIAASLKPGGHLITAHANVSADDSCEPGYNWDVPYGSKSIGRTLESIPGLRLIKEIRTPLYRVQSFRRVTDFSKLPDYPYPERIVISEEDFVAPSSSASIVCQGFELTQPRTPSKAVTRQLPILMYHRVAPEGSPSFSRYRVSPGPFEEQMNYLRGAGYYTISPEQWFEAATTRRPLPGNAIMITFDDAYVDFQTNAWPILKRHGFSSLLFVVTDHAGGDNRWEKSRDEVVPLLGWKELSELSDEGVQIGSHSMTHRRFTSLSHSEIIQEAARSRSILEEKVGRSVSSFAYPYGDTDKIAEHLVGSSGYDYGFAVLPLRRATFDDSLLAMPRIEVTGDDGLESFIAKLGMG